MTATTDQLAAAAPRVVLLTLRWGDSNIARYVGSSDDLVVNSNTHTALPEFDIEKLRLTGDLSPETLVFSAPAQVAPFENFVGDPGHARVRCTFAVCDPLNANATYREFFFGYLNVARPSDQDDEELYEYEFTGIKAELNKRLGFIADNYCQVWLGHPLCGVDLAAITETPTVTEIGTDGVANRITLDFGMSPPSLANARWQTGVLELDGLAIGILASLGLGKFDLEFPAPASWDSETITAEPGCNGIASTCRDVYQNQTNYVGFGLDMPDKYPLTEKA